MTRIGSPVAPVLWMDQDPKRLARDFDDIQAFAPSLVFQAPREEPQTHGAWAGPIPRWPFARPQPEGLDYLLGDQDFEIAMVYPSVYPMTPPLFYPLSLTPEPEEHSQSRWHVAPDGFLCLLQSTGGWLPEASPIELIAKAAGWRIEYALMKTGALSEMTTNGIVSDPQLDGLISTTGLRVRDDRGSDGSE